ncbi:MAG TPA: NAD-dependent epimerase/dehydratase family protein [Solirubrobacteraceae bacterium]|nr:NAD-dependent epimerase/dehydratase family protein [Solirubrobacteraceae bacterium]
MILVTGGAGFIGSHVVAALRAAGYPVRVLDVGLASAHREPPQVPAGVEYLRADVRDPDAVAAALTGVQAVSHQAAMVGLGVDLLDMPEYVAHNDLGTAVLLAGLARAGFRGRLVLASSMVVYGEGRYRCSEHGLTVPPARAADRLAAGHFEVGCPRCDRELTPESIPEEAPVDPRNVYAATKLHQEHLCAAFARETGASVVALRYHNVYGPGMPRDTPYAGVASIFASALAAGRTPRVFEDGGQLRDFIHVADVARANLRALEAQVPAFRAYNVATGQPTSVGAMARALSAAFPTPVEPEVTGEFRLGDVRHVFASADRADRELGFRAEVPFVQGMIEFAHAPLRA